MRFTFQRPAGYLLDRVDLFRELAHWDRRTPARARVSVIPADAECEPRPPHQVSVRVWLLGRGKGCLQRTDEGALPPCSPREPRHAV